MDMTHAIHVHQGHAQGQMLFTETTLHATNQWGDHKSISHEYIKKYEREAGDMIRRIFHLTVDLFRPKTSTFFTRALI